MRILVVEDDLELADGLVNSLAQADYATDVVHSGHAAVAACSTTPYPLVILDLGLPDLDGVEVLRRLRRQGVASPVLILSARDDLDDRILGLDAGDDYLAKPFAIGELEARIQTLLRRGAPAGAMLHCGKLDFDPISRQATVKDREVALTARELAVLEMLVRRPGRVVSKSQLFESLYDWTNEASPSVIEVFVSRLRRKLDDAGAGISIRMLRGLGYRVELASDDTARMGHDAVMVEWHRETRHARR